MKTSFFSSLKFKLVFFVTICVSASLLICGAYFFGKISKSLTQIQVDRLESETLIMSPLFVSAFNEIKSDVSVISSTPPIQGIVRSRANGGIDPFDGSTTELWRTRLANIFSGILRNKSSYTQIRYIGVEDGGREIVRVNKVAEGIQVVNEAELQRKEHEPYFQKGLELAPGEIFFSAVSLNRERGKIQKPFLPVIRGVVPVHGKDGNLFGMIVINASYEKVLSSVLDDIQIDKDLYVINEKGDYIRHVKGDGAETSFVFHSLIEEEDPQSAKLVNEIINSKEIHGTIHDRINNEDVVIRYHKQMEVFPDSSRFLAFALISSRDSFMAPVYQAQRETAIILVLSLGACMAITLFFSMAVIHPLVDMDTKIRSQIENDVELSGLPVHLKDEIGSLARSFNELYEKITKALIDEHHALARLGESEEQFRKVMEYSPVGKALVGVNGEWLKVNKALCGMLGYFESELLKTDFQTLTHPDDLEADLEQVQALLDGRIDTYKMEKRYIRKDGQLIWGLLSVSLLRDADGKPKHFISQIQDITDMKMTQQHLQELNAELEEFSYRTSHDLRSPLRSAIGLLALAKDSMDKGDNEKAETGFNLALNSLTKLEVLLKDILDLGRFKNAAEDPQDVDLKTVIDDALEKLNHMDNFGRLDVQLDIKVKSTIYTKKTRLVMIVENLISNAIKYQDPEKEQSFIKIEASENDDGILFAVEDNGLGIPKDQQANLFEMFKRFHPKVSFGSGLGMYMMKKSADVIGGEIRFVDKKDGARFELSLPKGCIRETTDLSDVA